MSVGRIQSAWRHVAVYAWHHPWARHDRTGTFRRILKWQLGSLFGSSARTVPWVNGSYLQMHKGQTGLTGNLYYGLHEFPDMAFFGHLLREGDVFADVGANAGSYSVLAAKVAGASVHAIEPAEETQASLAANLAANDISGSVSVHRVALGRENGQLRFTTGNDVTNRFAEDDDPDSVVVPVRTADEELCGLGIVAMKVDVERAEDQVFASAQKLLAEPQLVAIEVETLMPGVREAIESAGFIERFYDPFTRTLRASRASFRSHNHLFIRNEALVAERLRTAPALRYGKLSA